MFKNFQTIHYPLPSLSITGSAQAQRSVVRLRDLPSMVFGRFAHLKAISLIVKLTPTYTAVPTVVGHNALFNRIELFDGQMVRFTGSGNDLRMFERLENGGTYGMEALTNGGSTHPRYWTRRLTMGPPKFAGSPTDFVLPCACLYNGELRINWGVLTDISSDTTAYTASVQVIAELVLLDELRLPPFIERQVYTASGSDQPITGRAAYLFMSACNSNSYDAFTAQDISNVTVDTGQGQLVPSTNAQALTALFNADFARGEVGAIAGDPDDGTYDVNQRIVNLGTPTALAAQALDQQPFFWCPPGMRLSKVAALVENALRVRWSGANGSGTLLHVTRILPQSKTVLATYGDAAAKQLNLRPEVITKMAVKLASKADSYGGPMKDYLPHVLKVA